MTKTNHTPTDSFTQHLSELANREIPMPSRALDYQGYAITPLINHNPYLFHNWDACPENSPKRRAGKTVYMVTKEGYVDETYFKSLQTAKKFIRNCNNR